MGTRHLVCVVLDGELKIAQYGQWDGDPTGAGDTIVRFVLKKLKQKKFCRALRACSWYPASFDGDNIRTDFNKQPELDRSTGASIMEYVQDGFYPNLLKHQNSSNRDLPYAGEPGERRLVRRLVDSRGFAGDSLFCEWGYVLDMDSSTLEVYKGFQKKPHGSGRFIDTFIRADRRESDQYYPIKLIRKYYFSALTDSTMVLLDQQLVAEADGDELEAWEPQPKKLVPAVESVYVPVTPGKRRLTLGRGEST
jgi:hypothetical protein